jgi:hypothetical protein
VKAIGALLAVAFLAACSRSSTTSAEGGVTAPSATVAIQASAALGDAAPGLDAAILARTRVAPAEARRSRIAKFVEDPSLAGSTPTLEKHFPAASPAGFDVQSAELSVGKRRAILVSEAGKPTSQAAPIVVVVDEEGRVAWSKDHPIGGVLPPVGPLAIAAGPDGRVALAICDPPTKTAALRLWDDDGSPFADFQVLELDGCDALSLLYWPRRGWIVVAATAGSTRARLVTESGSLGWGRGLDLGARSRPGAIAAPSLAVDTDESFVLVQLVQPSATEGSAFHALAFRYDAQGSAIWAAAVDLGELPRQPVAGERATLRRLSPVGVHASVRGLLEVDVRPSGDVNRRREAAPLGVVGAEPQDATRGRAPP